MGLSVRQDVMEILEKRVKSRLSHRRNLILEIDAASFDHPQNGVPGLLATMLALPVHNCRSDHDRYQNRNPGALPLRKGLLLSVAGAKILHKAYKK